MPFCLSYLEVPLLIVNIYDCYLRSRDNETICLGRLNRDNRPYSYSQYWTGTSLQWRLMRGNILKIICI